MDTAYAEYKVPPPSPDTNHPQHDLQSQFGACINPLLIADQAKDTTRCSLVASNYDHLANQKMLSDAIELTSVISSYSIVDEAPLLMV